MTKVGRKLMEWDESEMVEADVNYRLENWDEFGYDEKPDEEELRRSLMSDCGFFETEWEFMTEYLTEKMKAKNKDVYWKVNVNNFGWRNQDGITYVEADDGQELLKEILPKCDCTFRIFNYGRGFAIQNFHHDSPIGNEWYYIFPCAMSTYEKNAGY